MKELTVREAVVLTGYTRQAIYNLVFNNRVASRKEGHEYRIDRQSLLDYTKGRGGRGKQQAKQSTA